MKYTNKLGWPQALYEAIKKNQEAYSPGESDYTATGLLKPARMVALETKYADNLETDVSSCIKSFVGNSIHRELEEAAKDLPGYVVEKRFYIEVDGVKIGAKIDLFDISSGILYDWKSTSVYSVRRGLKEEHAQQLNIGAECMRQAGYDVKGLKIAWLPTDHRSWEREKFDWYPEEYAEVDVPIISSEEVITFIKERVAAHKGAEKKLPKCSESETWGGRRCAQWCAVAPFCTQYKKGK